LNEKANNFGRFFQSVFFLILFELGKLRGFFLKDVCGKAFKGRVMEVI
jgi:hypothetical protein